MMPGKIKVFWLVSLVLVVAATAATAVKLWPRVEVSDLYRTYADMPGIDATFLHDFPLNDTVAVDVTILQASDSTGWERLLKDFGMTPPPPEVIEICGKAFIEMRQAPKSDYSGCRDTVLLNNDFIATSWYEKTIWVFVIETEEQYSAVLLNQVDESINRSLSLNKKE
jgi:hypothetical protein